MRILPTALVASVVIHTVAIAWALDHKIEPVVAVTVAPPPVEIEVVTPKPAVPEPVEVALLPDHSVPTATPDTQKISTSRSTSHETAATTSHTPSSATTPAKPHTGMMDMRRPAPAKPAPLKGPSDAFWDAFAANTKPLQPSAIEGQRIEDDVAREAEHLGNPRWVANASAEEVLAERAHQVASNEEREHHELKQKGQGYEAQHATFNGEVEADGTAHISEKPRYDPTEIVMNRHGIDPYASNKRRFLDNTREERYQIGKEYKTKQLSHSAQIASKNLAYLWSKTTDTVERKEVLFEMWDECAETGPDDLVAGGAAARAQIVGFIRGHMIGDLVYTAADLAAFNAKKKSSATFAPYE